MTLRFVAANRSLTVFHTLFHPSIVAVWHPARGERIGETQNAGPRHRHFAIAFASPIQRVLPTNMTITIRMLVTMGLMCLQPQKLLLHFGPSKHSPPTWVKVALKSFGLRQWKINSLDLTGSSHFEVRHSVFFLVGLLLIFLIHSLQLGVYSILWLPLVISATQSQRPVEEWKPKGCYACSWVGLLLAHHQTELPRKYPNGCGVWFAIST